MLLLRRSFISADPDRNSQPALYNRPTESIQRITTSGQSGGPNTVVSPVAEPWDGRETQDHHSQGTFTPAYTRSTCLFVYSIGPPNYYPLTPHTPILIIPNRTLRLEHIRFHHYGAFTCRMTANAVGLPLKQHLVFVVYLL